MPTSALLEAEAIFRDYLYQNFSYLGLYLVTCLYSGQQTAGFGWSQSLA